MTFFTFDFGFAATFRLFSPPQFDEQDSQLCEHPMENNSLLW